VIRVALADYDSRWPQLFEEHRRRIASALGPNVTRIEHVGSTSVPGLAAKPIVDIIVDGIDPVVGSGRLPTPRDFPRLAAYAPCRSRAVRARQAPAGDARHAASAR